MPETSEDLFAILPELFNGILGNPSSHPIELDRAHRALRPRGSSNAPRDVICRIHHYNIKEAIMRKSRTLTTLTWQGAPIQLFPDLSWHTLQKRRCLQPLLSLLRDNNITYRWGYPFSLTARKDGVSSTLRIPEDLPTFCWALHISCPRLPGWEPLPTHPSAPSTWTKVTPGKRNMRRSLQMSTPLSRSNSVTRPPSSSRRRRT